MDLDLLLVQSDGSMSSDDLVFISSRENAVNMLRRKEVVSATVQRTQSKDGILPTFRRLERTS